MKVAVVTPYYKEPLEKLRRCHDSVLAQTHACTHIMVADGHPVSELADWDVEHIVMPFAHADNGNTPRAIGAMSALNRRFDAVAYLDADNWFHPEHIESLVRATQDSGAPMAFSDRFIVSLDGEIMSVDENSSDKFADTSCIFHTMHAARLIPMWAMMDPSFGPICDRVFVSIANILGIPNVRTGRKTMYYETNYEAHYRAAGLPMPAEPRVVDISPALRDYSPARCIERLGFALEFR